MTLFTLEDAFTYGKTSLDEGSARRRGLHLYRTQESQQTNIHAPGGTRTPIPTVQRQQTDALDLAATEIGQRLRSNAVTPMCLFVHLCNKMKRSLCLSCFCLVFIDHVVLARYTDVSSLQAVSTNRTEIMTVSLC